VQETREIITTYPFGEPDPVPVLTRSDELWDRAARIYPYSFIDEFSPESEGREWTVVRMENPYIKVAVLPEVGGKVWGASEISTGQEFIYTNKVLKFREIALRGPWTSGGIEFNFGLLGHTPSGAHPVDYLVRTHPDGGVSCVVGSLDLPSRTRWNVTIHVPPDKAYFETRSFWYNPSSFFQSYYAWMNAAVRVSDDLQFVFPGNSWIGHHYSEPLRPWPEDAEGRDLSWYRNNDFGSYKSYFTVGEYADHFGGYWHDSEFGFGHWARYDDVPGQKIWIWGLSRQGMIWEDLLTDSDGQYSEPQAGRLLNQTDHALFPPRSGDRWKEIWFPYKDIGPMVAATPRAAVSLAREDVTITLGICPLEVLEDELLVSRGERELLRERMSLRPLETLIRRFEDEEGGAGWLRVRIGSQTVYTEDPSASRLQRPIRFKEYTGETVEDLFLAAERLVQERNYVQALPMFLELLESEPLHSKSLSRVAELYTRRGEISLAREYAERALDNAMYDPDANFAFGVVMRRQGHLLDAKEAFGWAARSLLYRSAAYSQMAEIFLLEEDYASALEYGQRAGQYDTSNPTALQVQAIALRQTGRRAEAEERLGQLLSFDPLNHTARFELYLLAPSEAHKDEFLGMVRTEYSHETFLEMALYYLGLGQREEALELLSLAEPYPMALYWSAYLQREHASGRSEALLSRAAQASALGIFPFREETIPVLEWALTEDPGPWQHKYYLALVLWSKGRMREAQTLLDECGDPGFAPLYHARAFFSRDADPNRALHEYRAAVRTDPDGWRNWFRLLEFCNRAGFQELAYTEGVRGTARFPHSLPIQVEFIRTLLERRDFREAADVLDTLTVLPSEGATGVHALYVRAHLHLALEAIGTGALTPAIDSLERSMLYPEHLGTGRPFDPDMRMQQYLQALCYQRQGERGKAEALFDAIQTFSERRGAQDRGENAYFAGLVFRKRGEDVRARTWLRRAERPSSDVLNALRQLEK
jgi:tetratricopeptide (TPR) repeat protein